MNVSKSAMDKWIRQLKQERPGITPKASPLTPEQIEIRELKKRIAELEEHKKGYRSVDVRLTEKFTIIERLKQSYSIFKLCSIFDVHRSSYKYWKTRPKTISAHEVRIRALVQKAHNTSNGSAGARTIVGIVTNYGISLSRYRASKRLIT
ncbi:hypothetical protein MACH09_45450 [Vibrio sp. MACH09]|nr:hypothetical protein MACH09_45450 [Vibrio sp. MACH09]